jgi:hypothetical protein
MQISSSSFLEKLCKTNTNIVFTFVRLRPGYLQTARPTSIRYHAGIALGYVLNEISIVSYWTMSSSILQVSIEFEPWGSSDTATRSYSIKHRERP